MEHNITKQEIREMIERELQLKDKSRTEYILASQEELMQKDLDGESFCMFATVRHLADISLTLANIYDLLEQSHE